MDWSTKRPRSSSPPSHAGKIRFSTPTVKAKKRPVSSVCSPSCLTSSDSRQDWQKEKFTPSINISSTSLVVHDRTVCSDSHMRLTSPWITMHPQVLTEPEWTQFFIWFFTWCNSALQLVTWHWSTARFVYVFLAHSTKIPIQPCSAVIKYMH